jgi:single-strand selective monofunctional uracil DNA glycosylase
MTQTGVPFGEVAVVRDWLKITDPVMRPAGEHPKKPVLGLECRRSEVSGRRLWGMIKEVFETPQRFFRENLVINYCPLLFLDAGGANLTPDKLAAAERAMLSAACDHALRRMIQFLQPEHVVGVGNCAAAQAEIALHGLPVKIVKILHPSPSSPAANRGWQEAALKQLAESEVAFVP